MNTVQKSRPVIEQVTNNTTSWIGRRTDNKELLCGQTFISPTDGDLETIEIYSSIVSKPGKVVMTLHHFDQQNKTWGPPIASSSMEVNNSFSGKWIPFHIPGMHFVKNGSYGFRLESSTAYMGLGEAAGSYAQPPFRDGQEWQFTNHNQEGNPFSYFSLAFRVGLRA
jgi:hypothetical protein